MREFFLNLLNNLDKLAGLKQLDKIYAIHGEDLEGAKKEINILLTVLCDVSKQFPFIPEYEQQKIISHAVISDPEFMSLNGSIIYKWLAKNKDRFFKESHHIENDQAKGEPLTGEARAAKLDEWLKSLASTEQMIIARIDKKDIEREGKEWSSEIERKAVSTTPDPDRIVYTKESLKERNERIRAMQQKAFRDRNPGASEDEVALFMIEAKRHEVPIPLTQEKTDIKTNQ